MFRTPGDSAWRSEVKVVLSNLSCQQKAKPGQPCQGCQTWLSVPPSTFFPYLFQQHSLLGGARGAVIPGKLDL